MHCPRIQLRTRRPLPLPLLCLSALLLLILMGLSACGTSAGIFHSSGDWQSSNLPQQHVRSLTTDPNNAQHVFAGTENGSVLVSTDGGANWKEKFLDPKSSGTDNVHALGFDFSGKRFYAASDKSLCVSTDNGQTWQVLTSATLPADQYTALAFSFKSSSTFYLGTAHHGVYKSSDSGQTWQALDQSWPTNTAVNNLAYVTDSQQLWAATSTGIYRESGDNSAWQALNTGLPTATVTNALVPLAFYGGDHNIVLAGTENGFFISQDDGAHWSPSKDSLRVAGVLAIQVDFRQSSLNTVYAGTGAGALQSDDQGQTWRAVASGLPQGVGVHALTLGATDNAQLFAGADNVYLDPGYGNNAGGTDWFTILLFVAFFVLVYYFMQRGRRRSLDGMQRRMAARSAATASASAETPGAPASSAPSSETPGPATKSTTASGSPVASPSGLDTVPAVPPTPTNSRNGSKPEKSSTNSPERSQPEE